MKLDFIEIKQFRNISTAQLHLSPGFNILYGENGSGKTSILEAISLLGLGRSFRSHLLNKAIQYDKDRFSIFSLLKDPLGAQIPIGLEKSQTQAIKIKYNGLYIDSIAELAQILPLQLINADTFQLLEAGPRYRRQFLDWGVFHVEQRFFGAWKRMQRALKQRNAALKAGQPNEQIQAWNEEFVESSLLVEGFRQAYFQKVIPILNEMLRELIILPGLMIEYKQGWASGQNLSELLVGSLARDRILGSTQLGPHRTDILIKINGIPVDSILSRGERKILACALRLSQGVLLKELSAKQCLYLLDDLPAELDAKHCAKVLSILESLEAQVFMTGILPEVFFSLKDMYCAKVFHVEHGEVILNQLKTLKI